MDIIIAVTVGILFGAGIFCLLRRSLVRIIMGVTLLSHGANLLVFTSGGLRTGKPAFIPGKEALAQSADPLPQALVLTAIVIGLGLIVFTLSLLLRAFEETGTDRIDEFNRTDISS